MRLGVIIGRYRELIHRICAKTVYRFCIFNKSYTQSDQRSRKYGCEGAIGCISFRKCRNITPSRLFYIGQFYIGWCFYIGQFFCIGQCFCIGRLFFIGLSCAKNTKARSLCSLPDKSFLFLCDLPGRPFELRTVVLCCFAGPGISPAFSSGIVRSLTPRLRLPLQACPRRLCVRRCRLLQVRDRLCGRPA